MKFKEWLDKMDAQQKRLAEAGLFAEIEEAIPCEGNSIPIHMDTKESESGKYDLRYLRSDFPKHREEFESCLERVTLRVDSVVENSSNMLRALVDNQTPGLVMARMKGEAEDSDPKEVFKKMVGEKAKELWRPLRKFPECIDEIKIHLQVAGETLKIDKGSNAYTWGNIQVWRGSRSKDGLNVTMYTDLTKCLFFITNIAEIRQAIVDTMDKLNKAFPDEPTDG